MPLFPNTGNEPNKRRARIPISPVVVAGLILILTSFAWTPAAKSQGAATNTNDAREVESGFTGSKQTEDPSGARAFARASRTFRNFNVESVEEFVKMQRHHEQVLSEGKITHKFKTANGQLVHCVEIGSQGSVKRSGVDPKSISSTPAILPGGGQTALVQNVANPADFGMDGSLDNDGNRRSCPPGSVPIMIPSLEDLCRFKKLEHRFWKYPPGNHYGSGGRTNQGRA